MNRTPIRLTRRGEYVLGTLIWLGFLLLMGILGGIENGTIPLP